MIFRQLFDADTSSYTYLIADPASKEAALIDPVYEQVDRDLGIVRELGLQLTHVLETHVHADHVTGAGLLRERTGCTVVAGAKGASCADRHVHEGEVLEVGGLQIHALATPGHTDDSMSFLVDGKLFTGDALLIRTCGRTDFQNGDAGQLFDAVHTKLFSLPAETVVYPAHDYAGHTSSTIEEERAFNRRLVGRSRESFIELMGGLNLPKPRYIDIAVPANRACGRMDGVADTPTKPRVMRDASVDELEWLSQKVRKIDVRELHEFNGELGHLEGSELVPLDTLPQAAADWPREQPLLLICRVGGRSWAAVEQLAKMGFEELYNLAGGMTAVRAQERL